MKRRLMGAALVTLAFLLSGCSEAEEISGGRRPRILGATYMTRNNPYFDVLHEAIEDVVEANGDILISRDPSQDQEKQNDQILEMLDEGIEVLFLNPVDWETVKPALEACREHGVAVIDIDTAVKDREYVVSIIETDNYEAGVQCAEDLMSRLDEARIVVLGNPGQASITSRVQGFLDTLADKPEYEIVYQAAAQGEFEVSAEIMGEILELSDQEILFDAVLGGNDPTALGILSALQQHHREEGVLIYGIDGSPDFKAMLETGNVTGTSAQNPREIGEVAAQIAYEYLEGNEVEEYVAIEPQMITLENLSDYEVNGWGW